MEERLLAPSPKSPSCCAVPVATLRWWLHNGTGPDHFKIGRRIMYRGSDVDRWLEAQRRRGGGTAA